MNAENKNISLTYYAFLKENRGLEEESLTTSAETAGDLFEELCEKYGFRVPKEGMKVSVNDHFTAWDTKLKGDDHVVFIPPISGG